MIKGLAKNRLTFDLNFNFKWNKAKRNLFIYEIKRKDHQKNNKNYETERKLCKKKKRKINKIMNKNRE